jgi:hypothetical protein
LLKGLNRPTLPYTAPHNKRCCINFQFYGVYKLLCTFVKIS